MHELQTCRSVIGGNSGSVGVQCARQAGHHVFVCADSRCGCPTECSSVTTRLGGNWPNTSHVYGGGGNMVASRCVRSGLVQGKWGAGCARAERRPFAHHFSFQARMRSRVLHVEGARAMMHTFAGQAKAEAMQTYSCVDIASTHAGIYGICLARVASRLCLLTELAQRAPPTKILRRRKLAAELSATDSKQPHRYWPWQQSPLISLFPPLSIPLLCSSPHSSPCEHPSARTLAGSRDDSLCAHRCLCPELVAVTTRTAFVVLLCLPWWSRISALVRLPESCRMSRSKSIGVPLCSRFCPLASY